MKIKNLIATAALLVAISAANETYALTASQAKKLKETVLSVPVPEIPTKAAELVRAASADTREDVAVTIVRAVVSKHRAAAPIVVSAISKAAPEVSAAVAKAAIVVAPEAKAQIQVAASSAAPSQSAQVAAINNVAAPATTITANSPAPQMSTGAGEVGAVRGNAQSFGPPTQGQIVIKSGAIRYQNAGTPVAAPTPVKKTGPREE